MAVGLGFETNFNDKNLAYVFVNEFVNECCKHVNEGGPGGGWGVKILLTLFMNGPQCDINQYKLQIQRPKKLMTIRVY